MRAEEEDRAIKLRLEEAKIKAEEEERHARQRAEEEDRAIKLRIEEARLKAEDDERKMEILRLQANLPPAGQASQGAVIDVGRALCPKLPKFDEEKDDIDAFLERFERFATTQ